VTEPELLGQKTWRVRATVAHCMEDESDIDLCIYVTEKILAGGKTPEVGNDIKGIPWLQGYLWYPEPLAH